MFALYLNDHEMTISINNAKTVFDVLQTANIMYMCIIVNKRGKTTTGNDEDI